MSVVTRRAWVGAARVVFVASAIFFGWWSLRDEWPMLLAALGAITAWQWLISAALVVVGLMCTGIVWERILVGYGYRLPIRSALSVFFVGQIGKYIPGSVWSLAAQGQMARTFNVPVRITVATGLVFLYWNVVTAILLGSLLIAWGQAAVTVSRWGMLLVALLALSALLPATVTAVANRLAGTHASPHTRWSDIALLLPLMVLTWTAYGAAVLFLVPGDANGGSGPFPLTMAITAFAFSYILGVLVPLAPAGFGIREAAMIYFLSPHLGLALAAAVALLTRVIHTIADFAIAAASWVVGRRARLATSPGP